MPEIRTRSLYGIILLNESDFIKDDSNSLLRKQKISIMTTRLIYEHFLIF